jgi:hypothetical protein
MDITENIIKDRKIVEYHQIIVHNYWENLSKVKYVVKKNNSFKLIYNIIAKKTHKSLACGMN